LNLDSFDYKDFLDQNWLLKIPSPPRKSEFIERLFVIPTKVGIHVFQAIINSRLRENNGISCLEYVPEHSQLGHFKITISPEPAPARRRNIELNTKRGLHRYITISFLSQCLLSFRQVYYDQNISAFNQR
jgi:hypothetical protein